jgi:hypothetical protein
MVGVRFAITIVYYLNFTFQNKIKKKCKILLNY